MQQQGLPQKSPLEQHNYAAAEAVKYYTVQVGFTTFRIDERYQNLAFQGDGSFGCVVSAYDTLLKRSVAIKKIRNPLSDRSNIKRILREIKLLNHFSGHENIITIYDIMTDPPNVPEFEDLYLVTNLYETDLHAIIKSNQPLTEHHFQFFLYQTLRGLKYTHSANVIHRDLKPSNLLLNASCDLAICDFGLGRAANHNFRDPLTDYVVTRYYRAPEILCECEQYGKAVDIWSVGCIFAELVTRTPFFKGENPLEQLQAILNKIGGPGSKEKLGFIKNKTALHTILSYQKEVSLLPHFGFNFPDGTSFLLLDLLKKMLQFNPEDRITVDDALKHPYLNLFHSQVPELTCPQTFSFNFERSYVNYDLIFAHSQRRRLIRKPIKVSRLDECAGFRHSQESAISVPGSVSDCPTHSTAGMPTFASALHSSSRSSHASSSSYGGGGDNNMMMEMDDDYHESEEDLAAKALMVEEMMVKEARHHIVQELSKYRYLNAHMNAFLVYGAPKCII